MSEYRKESTEQQVSPDVVEQQPNKNTIAAMREAERIAKDPSMKGYNDLDELFAALKKGSK